MKLSDLPPPDPNTSTQALKLSDVQKQPEQQPSYWNKMTTAYGREVGGAYQNLKQDFQAASPASKPGYASEPFLDQAKDQFHALLAQGSLPVDAFNLVMAGLVNGPLRAGLATPIAAGEHYAFTHLPGLGTPEQQAKRPGNSQEELEDQVMLALSVVAPEKGVALPMTGERVITSAELRAAAKQHYTTVDNSGMRIRPTAMQTLHTDIQDSMNREGFRGRLHPYTREALKEVTGVSHSGNMQSLSDMDRTKRVVNAAIKKTYTPDGSDDRRLLRMVKDHIDDFIDNLHPGQLQGVRQQSDIDALKQARVLWSRYAKGEALDELVEKARGRTTSWGPSGFENSLRNEFRKLADNKRGMARFTKEEREAIKAVRDGGPISNALRQLGKFAPHGPISILPALAGYGTHGVEGAVAVAVPTEAARQASRLMTLNRAKKASELVRLGRPATPAPLASRVGQTVVPSGLLQHHDVGLRSPFADDKNQ